MLHVAGCNSLIYYGPSRKAAIRNVFSREHINSMAILWSTRIHAPRLFWFSAH